MSHEIEDLYERWQRNPDGIAETMALCEALRGSHRADLVEIVGSHASRQLDVGTLLATARMYTDSGRLEDAQAVLLSAGRLAPRDGDVYRWLGEVLLRRGDAERAEKVLEKALQFGAENGANPLLERARALVPTQKANGQEAVAAAVAKSNSPHLMRGNDRSQQTAKGGGGGGGGAAGRLVPAETDEDVETQIRRNDDVKAAIEAALAPISQPLPAAGRPIASSPPPPMVAPPPSTRPPPFQAPHMASPADLIFTTPTRNLGFDVANSQESYGAAPSFEKSTTRDNELVAGAFGGAFGDSGSRGKDPFEPPKSSVSAQTAAFGSPNERFAANPFLPPPPSANPFLPPPSAPVSAPAPIPQHYAPPAAPPPQQHHHNHYQQQAREQNDGPDSSLPLAAAGGLLGGVQRRPVEPPVNPMLLEALARPSAKLRDVSLGGASVPEPRDVLDALQVAGVYEPDGAVKPHAYEWSKPQGGRRRIISTLTLVIFAVGLVVGGVGTFRYVTDRRGKEHLEAEALLAKVNHDLELSDAKLLEPSEKAISRSFELESRSPRAAIAWLHERALVGLLKGGADLAFEDATQRAKAVGIEEKRVAFAYIASFLFQNDTAGAAAMIVKYDTSAHEDAWFQLMAGATFERAGDQRAAERYAAAVKLDPELVVAQILLTRSTAVDGNPRRAAELAKEFRIKYPDRVEGYALVALTWTRDPLRGEPPAEMKEVVEKGDGLPTALRSIPHASRALLALYKGNVDEAKPSLQKGLEVADTPGIAAWLGSIALATGDENLARKAALTAVSFSAVYPPARVLAARVALLGARLDEALKATEDLPPSSPDVAIVTAAASYEKLDGERMARAFDAVPEETKKLPFAIPLIRGQALLAGNLSDPQLKNLTGDKVFDMADDDAPWADLVAMDWALDLGDVDVGKKIADRWRGEPRPMRAIRLARLSRYEGKLEEADKLSKAAIEGGAPTMRVLSERVFTLVAMKRDADALALFKTYPNVGGPMLKWLRAFATAAHGKLDEARAIVSTEDPPGPGAAMPSRIIAACAYGAMKDVRHGPEYMKPIVGAGFTNPDVAAAADKLGLGKVTFKKR